MTISHDLEENEIKTLIEFAGMLAGKRVLEIGCGDGRLTWRYASRAAEVVAIDPSVEMISKAGQDLPAELSDRVSFHALELEQYVAQQTPNIRTKSFDLVILAWSL
jgi:cyclopropane fatty-acyl-phospholipid synthase-like methyltransferase